MGFGNKSARATVITGAPLQYEQLFKQFAHAHLEGHVNDLEHIEFIHVDSMDRALARISRECEHQAARDYRARDLLQSKALQSFREGSKACVVVACVAYDRTHSRFDCCEHLVRGEVQHVREWGYFRRIIGGCLTPNGSLEYLITH